MIDRLTQLDADRPSVLHDLAWKREHIIPLTHALLHFGRALLISRIHRTTPLTYHSVIHLSHNAADRYAEQPHQIWHS